MSIKHPKRKHKERYGRDDLRPTEVEVTRDENDIILAQQYEPVEYPGLIPRPSWQAGKAGDVLSWVVNSLPDDPGLIYPLGGLQTDKPKQTAQSGIKHYAHNDWLKEFEQKLSEAEIQEIELSDDSEEPGQTFFNIAPGYLGREITSTTMAAARHQENKEALELQVSEQGKRYVKAQSREDKIKGYQAKYKADNLEPLVDKLVLALVEAMAEDRPLPVMREGTIVLNNLALKRLDKLGRELKPADVLAALGF